MILFLWFSNTVFWKSSYGVQHWRTKVLDEKLIALFCQNDKSSFSAFFCMTVVNLSLWCVLLSLFRKYFACRQSQLHYHNARQHDGQRPHPCTAPGCERKFYKKSDLKTHAKLHLGVKDHPCPICQRKFSHVSNLNRHLLTHKKAISQLQSQSHCLKIAQNVAFEFFEFWYFHQFLSFKRSDLTANTIWPPSFNLDNVECDIFNDFQTPCLSLLMTHFNEIFMLLQEKPYACHLCGQRYNQIATLNQHLKKHDVPKSIFSRNFHCHFCGLRFSHKADLNLHQKQEHETQPTPYVCRRCKRGFAQLSGISGHHCILLEEKIDIPIEHITVQEPEVVTSIIIQETVTEVVKAAEEAEIVQSEIVSCVFVNIG